MEATYGSAVWLGRRLISLMGWRMHGHGLEHVPSDGRAVVATNHVSYLDPIIVEWAAAERGRHLRFLAKRELFGGPAGVLLRRMRHVPVDRDVDARTSLDAAVAMLERGEAIAVFPEATISTSFVPAEGKTGAARMAMAAGAPLVPGAVWGGQRMLTKGVDRDVRRGVALTARFGAPVAYAADEDPRAVTDRLMARIAELVEASARAYPQQPEGPDDLWWLPRHLGGTAPTPEQAAERRRREAEQRRRRGEQRRGGQGADRRRRRDRG